MKVLLLLSIGLFLAPFADGQEKKEQVRKDRILIVNIESQSISFFTRCGEQSFGERQTLEPHEKAEFRCRDGFEILIRTHLPNEKPQEVLRSLEEESRNALFWDSENRRYDCRRVD